MPLGVIGTRNCFPLRLLLACSPETLACYRRLTTYWQLMWSYPCTLATHRVFIAFHSPSAAKPSLPPSLIHTYIHTHTHSKGRRAHRHAHLNTHSVLFRLLRQWKYHWIIHIASPLCECCGHACMCLWRCCWLNHFSCHQHNSSTRWLITFPYS